MSHSIQITFACEDPGRLADFWSGALGYINQPPPAGYDTWEEFATEAGIPEESWNDVAAVVDPGGNGPRLLFEKWDAGEPSKKVHIDINSLGHREGESVSERAVRLQMERERLERIGAVFGREGTGAAGETFIEMYDPEGNWLCVQ
jgi:hypothetical protein